jgi:2'-hydroxyisoflavone reductase
VRVLVLGGSVFLGRAVVEAALARGDEVTTLTRGLSGPVPDGARALTGDRREPGGLDALAGGEWDVVVDVCRSSPTQVAAAVQALAGRAGRYVYVSSVSVYASYAAGPPDEDSPVLLAAEAGTDEDDMEHYGPLKVRCEELVRASFGDRALVVRPGLIVGPDDPSHRFTYWVARAMRGGSILAPGQPGAGVRFIDVRDLASWLVRADAAGTYNAVGPDGRMTMGELIQTCIQVGGVAARPVWVDDDFLLAHGVVPYTEMPLWVPAIEDFRYFAEVDSGRAVTAGLSFRPVSETVADTVKWISRHQPLTLRAGLDPARETELLEQFAGPQ